MSIKSRLREIGLLTCLLAAQHAFPADVAGGDRTLSSRPLAQADFSGERTSLTVRKLANWVVEVADNHGLPFMIVDKNEARVFLFDAAGRLRGSTSALLGLARGDESVPGIGTRKLSSIRPEERTTPAGRFVANLDRGLKGESMLWVDYETAISLHPVITGNAKEQRQKRLTSPSPSDNRISFGCINVPAPFFNDVVMPAFRATDGIVYILPDTKSLQAVFVNYVDRR